MNSQSGTTGCYVTERRPDPAVGGDASLSASEKFLLVDGVVLDRLFIRLSEIPLLKMLHTDGAETSSRREFSHRPRPSSSDNRDQNNTGRENLSQLTLKILYTSEVCLMLGSFRWIISVVFTVYISCPEDFSSAQRHIHQQCPCCGSLCC